MTEHMVFLQLEQIFVLLALNEQTIVRIMVINLMHMDLLILHLSVDARYTRNISFCQWILNKYTLMLHTTGYI